MAMKWELADYTKGTGGYMSILLDGERVADVFPFAAKNKLRPAEIKLRAAWMVEVLNKHGDDQDLADQLTTI